MKIDTNLKETEYGVLIKKKNAVVKTVELPGSLGKNEIYIKQDVCNICTSDYEQWQGLREHQGYPMAGGHESVGTVLQTGKNVVDLKSGDRVCFAYNSCQVCEYCKVGRTDKCKKRREIETITGIKGYMGFARHIVRDSRSLVKINKKVKPSEAGFVEPLATVISAQNNIDIQLGDTIIVIGAGTMGILNALVARLSGARVIISELLDKKIEVARAYGFDVIDAKSNNVEREVNKLTDGKMADSVILAVGNKQATDQSFNLVKELDGQILFFSAYYPASDILVSPNEIHYRRLRLIGAYLTYMEHFYTASRILGNDLIDVSPIIEKTFDLQYIQEAFEYASRPGMYRVSVTL